MKRAIMPERNDSLESDAQIGNYRITAKHISLVSNSWFIITLQIRPPSFQHNNHSYLAEPFCSWASSAVILVAY